MLAHLTATHTATIANMTTAHRNKLAHLQREQRMAARMDRGANPSAKWEACA